MIKFKIKPAEIEVVEIKLENMKEIIEIIHEIDKDAEVSISMKDNCITIETGHSMKISMGDFGHFITIFMGDFLIKTQKEIKTITREVLTNNYEKI